ncbi:MAG: SIR2 family protein [Ignavibacteriaceae bacterium]
MITEKKKTVFFLGAGFSCAAGAPSQKELLGKVINYSGDDYGNPVDYYLQNIKMFFRDAFSLDDNKMRDFSLEDFYTPIDKCILQNSSFRGYSIDHIKKIRNELSTLISIVIDAELTNSAKDKTYLDKFVDLIIDFINRDLNYSYSRPELSIITTNWDILLDRRFYQKSIQQNFNLKLDYGTPTINLIYSRPSYKEMLKRIFDLQFYKIHGSLNWLKCSSCNRLFINPEEKAGIIDINLNKRCRFCEDTFKLPSEDYLGINLEPQIIYPTFMKDFSNIHFSQIWDNASITLSEASNIVFIGYSFQQADYEIRQLLSRKVPDNCKITVVLNNNNKDTFKRYKDFFGRRDYRELTCGVKIFIRDYMQEYL